ncbi:DUF1617 family protein [Enterococcus casseliflavus]|uniref:DUF1617 family protein n=1 Tax=Enterococcus sp. 8E11_MSG4843 TaxID=1834190 RepID=UPI000B3EDB94|nr:DUF1617 family protein [Enterococcus sp. 8E11_MSG4843]MBO1097349.1 DUF1617 family protein [Enterococcus casseliflavus]MBO1144474.1 DUF1617 family protein [Enterococcus casseliflavus]OUZ36163.1 hypothetical protein A5885_000349 [Enterococcus sp. 8E11_MSG4843]
MKITLKNYELGSALVFVQKMELKAAESRHRSKFKKALMKAIEGLQESELELYEQYGQKDHEDKLIVNENQTGYLVQEEHNATFIKEMNVLLDEEIIIESGLYAKNFSLFGKILASYNGVISGKEADIYDRLMDEFEKEEKQDVKD